MRLRTLAPLAAAGLLLAACELPGRTSTATPTPSPARSPFAFPANYSPGPYVPRESQPAPTLAPGRPDACALLTKAEAKTALAGAPRVPVMRDLGNVVRCTWGNPDLSKIIYVEVFARSSQTATAARAMYDQNLKAAARPNTVSGVGDAAFTSRYYAFVLKGSTVLKITYQEPHYPDIDQSILTTLATEAGNRLSA